MDHDIKLRPDLLDRAERRDLAEERDEENYRELYEEIEAVERDEWFTQFGGNPLFPFEPDHAAIHAAVMRKMRGNG